MIRTSSIQTPRPRAWNLLNLPWLGPFLRWRYARPAMQSVMLLVAALLLFDGFLGPQLAYKNIATVSAWVHYRGFLMLALLVFGNFFCMVCPFMLPRKGAKWLQARLHLARGWPTWLPQKGIAIVLLVLFFWSYEAFNLWKSPWLTAWVALGYFGAAFLTDLFFKGAAFCKHICPVGQFNMLYSTISPTEIAVVEMDICESCVTKDCIAGRDGIPGCELHLFQPKKVGNLDCTFCLDCVHACPYDNVGILSRVPGAELLSTARRSGIGRLSERFDIAFLILVLSFGAFMQAFGMIPPVYELEAWLAARLGLRTEAPVLALIFVVGLIVLPLALVSGTAWLSQRGGRGMESLKETIARFAPGMVPIGAGMWAAHYAFHFFSGALALIPVLQSFIEETIGADLLGKPRWDLAGLLTLNQILVVESFFLYAGLLGSLLLSWLIAAQVYRTQRRTLLGWLPWATLFLLMLGTGMWIMLNPMEMRGTICF
ncbi:MAG: FesM [Ardenticatenales bacterium]|nr:FesM [Ardenticatenales bacterium]